jgi:nitrogen fixation protein FixH
MKKISYIFLLFTSIVCSQGISSGLFFSQEGAKSSNSKKVTITFDKPPTSVNVHKAYYKYDKEFAFSFGMDDGLIGAYNTGVPLFTGGTVIHQDGVTEGYPGLFYSDGAGNKKAFSATMNINMNNIGTSAERNMSETMLKDAYVKGFALTNHGFTPKTQFESGGWNEDPVIKDQQITYEIEENYNRLRSLTGIKMDNFTAPSNDISYEAITTQMKADGVLKIVNNIGNTARERGHDYTAEYWIANEPTMWFSRDFTLWTNGTVSQSPSDFDFINTKLTSVGSEHAWFTLGVHNVDISETGSPGGGALKYLDFKYVMEGLEQYYGTGGADNMWMAPINMVYEYLTSARDASYTVNTVGNKSTISFNFSAVSSKFLEHALSLIINADANITNITYEGFDESSAKLDYQGLGDNNALINVSYKPPYQAATYKRLEATVAVELVQITLSESDLEYAQQLVNVLPSGSFKAELQADLDALTIMPNSIVVKIDFGRNINGSTSPYPWNNFSTPDAPGHLVGAKLTGINTTKSTKSVIDIEITAPFEKQESNVSFSEGDPRLPYPFTSCKDVFKVKRGTTATLRVSNLDENKIYNFVFYASRGFVGNFTEYSVNGGGDVTLTHKGNISDTASILNVVPSVGGFVDINIKGNGGNPGYIGVLEITEFSND